MCRVNEGGGMTDIYIKMSKYNKEKDTYEPKEYDVQFPAKRDRIYHSIEVWGQSFIN